jgi:hypothetical protein
MGLVKTWRLENILIQGTERSGVEKASLLTLTGRGGRIIDFILPEMEMSYEDKKDKEGNIRCFLTGPRWTCHLFHKE